MALTPYQRGIVKRFYEHRETLAVQKLAETVSELYVCESDKKADQLWKRVETHLRNSGGDKAWVKKIIAERDLGELAAIVGELY
jgi:hypothetical protein